MQLTTFIGSSEKDLPYARAIEKILQSHGVTVLGWWDPVVFPQSETLIESLEKLIPQANAAVFVAGRGDAVRRGRKMVYQPRDNVILEYGMFAAARGRANVGLAALVKNIELPSDIWGVKHMRLTPGKAKPFDEQAFIAANTAEIESWLNPLIERTKTPPATARCWTTIGDSELLLQEHLVPEINRASQIDMLTIYRPFSKAMYQHLGNFRANAANRLRVCFANVWDPALAEVFRRKITGKRPSYFEDGVVESVQRYLGDDASIDPTTPDQITATSKAAYAADYRIYLTPQRITYNYCRVGDVMMIIPLDMKKDQYPSPPGWIIRRGDAPGAFTYYEKEFDTLIGESQRIYGR